MPARRPRASSAPASPAHPLQNSAPLLADPSTPRTQRRGGPARNASSGQPRPEAAPADSQGTTPRRQRGARRDASPREEHGSADRARDHNGSTRPDPVARAGQHAAGITGDDGYTVVDRSAGRRARRGATRTRADRSVSSSSASQPRGTQEYLSVRGEGAVRRRLYTSTSRREDSPIQELARSPNVYEVLAADETATEASGVGGQDEGPPSAESTRGTGANEATHSDGGDSSDGSEGADGGVLQLSPAGSLSPPAAPRQLTAGVSQSPTPPQATRPRRRRHSGTSTSRRGRGRGGRTRPGPPEQQVRETQAQGAEQPPGQPSAGEPDPSAPAVDLVTPARCAPTPTCSPALRSEPGSGGGSGDSGISNIPLRYSQDEVTIWRQELSSSRSESGQETEPVLRDSQSDDDAQDLRLLNSLSPDRPEHERCPCQRCVQAYSTRYDPVPDLQQSHIAEIVHEFSQNANATLRLPPDALDESVSDLNDAQFDHHHAWTHRYPGLHANT